MVLVVGLGVMFSTFLSGAVAMLATLGCMLVGFFARFVGDLFTSVIENNRRLMAGGGPIESFVRLITQKTITVPYDSSPGSYATIVYEATTGKRLWARLYRGPDQSLGVGSVGSARAVAFAPNGTQLYVTGRSGTDYATIAYNG